MEIILNQDIPKLGYKGDVVSVKPGYARNFLIPQGMAIVANASNRKMLAEMTKQQTNKIAKIRQDAENLANRIEGLQMTLKAKVGTGTKIFGSVTTLQVAHMLKDAGIEVDRRLISFLAPIKEVGQHKVMVECYKGIVANATLNVVADRPQ
ncbi:MAG: 50S ribosomal protein L9 [Bacteroidetes bacterium]|jgi:large subunit ribosomal protein L9|nr:50S ribosomal protein L9 [Bacteroidota bacterium]